MSNNNNAPTFLDRFVVHLADKLLSLRDGGGGGGGVRPVEAWLQESAAGARPKNGPRTTPPRRTLYWRSRFTNDHHHDLLISSPSTTIEDAGSPRKDALLPDDDGDDENDHHLHHHLHEHGQEQTATTTTTTTTEETLSFIDLTFSIGSTNNRNEQVGDNHETFSLIAPVAATARIPQMQLRIGYFWVSSTAIPASAPYQPNKTINKKTKARYVQTQPLTQEHLEAHAQSIGIDLFSGPPQAMAAMMAQALQSLGSGATEATTTTSPPPTTGACRMQHQGTERTQVVEDSMLYYADVQERGTWKLSVESISPFDAVGTNLLYFNLLLAQQSPRAEQNTKSVSNNNNHSSGTSTTIDTSSDEVLIDRRLQECWDQLVLVLQPSSGGSQHPPSESADPASSNPLPTASNTRTAGIKRSASGSIASNNNKAYVAIVDGTKKRKKKGKLMYAKPS